MENIYLAEEIIEKIKNGEEVLISNKMSLITLFCIYSKIVHFIDGEIISFLEDTIKEKILQLEKKSELDI